MSNRTAPYLVLPNRLRSSLPPVASVLGPRARCSRAPEFQDEDAPEFQDEDAPEFQDEDAPEFPRRT